jgi:hypothetical protein
MYAFFASHGRDNKIHVWHRPSESVSIRQGGAASLTDLTVPALSYSLDVNAMNYCRFSLLPLSSLNSEGTALIAVPNLVESALVGFITIHIRSSHVIIQSRRTFGCCLTERDYTPP